MKFRCCGNQSILGHADNCPLKPETSNPVDTSPPAVGRARGSGAGSGCQFDILDFEHIGECQGTCGDQGESIRFDLGEGGVGGGKIVIVEIDMDDPESLAKLEKLIEQGKVRPMTEEETREVTRKLVSGELEVEIKKMSLAEFLEMVEHDQSQEPQMDEDPFLDIKQAAEALGFSHSWTRTLCRKGRLPGALKLMRKWAIPRSAIFEEDD